MTTSSLVSTSGSFSWGVGVGARASSSCKILSCFSCEGSRQFTSFDEGVYSRKLYLLRGYMCWFD
ncbi:ORF1082 [White spot syndrome virus]|uniref:Wsv208 n=3 Tax=White spot syndrome virus TaxID=342409 RepID=Q8VB05_WSSVS|nr:wsv208 [Shrimp white spot syndrome virus]AFX59585.1 wsv208 [White spot syndrome virus]AAL33212.1 wsv208 [Shrimp white spot syndrome virus]AAL89131.1 WSSV263 [Shrimp white spot syndrome virus]ATU84117.1 ORF1082 [White spot syndrome virus]AWQ60381.1 wsv208 [Shrimp white spot syndrome virus]